MKRWLVKLLTILMVYNLMSLSAYAYGTDPIADLVALPANTNAAPVQLRAMAVVGDYVADWIGEFLTNYYQDRKDLPINNIAHTNTGFLEANALSAQTAVLMHEKPNIIIICIGSNDVQELNGTLPNSQEFLALYKQKATDFAKQLKNSGAQILWVSAPPFNLQKHDETVANYNEIYKQLCLENGFDFIDIWRDFLSPNDSIPLRTKNMIGFTAEGIDLLTKELREKIDANTSYTVVNKATPQATQSGPWNILDVTGTNDRLAGADIKQLFTPISPNYLVATPPKGRADDFSQY
ncbi:MAG: GDSL-type esterase/lipase family protein [Alphaproteobacteria bacterium]|nr:GDSL-type esterase/lipase family protein [Alphaproteobacteria bacterium]